MLTPVTVNRAVVLDTETTGLNPHDGHRIIEIGCVELINRRLTGKRYHEYLNPERDIDSGALEVHGITNEFLQDKPRFADIASDFLAFIDGAQLIIHNAPFDVGFINYEFSLLDEETPKNLEDFCTVFDTLTYARQKHPGQRNSLDALCKRYAIDNSHRELHGALLDSEILADVFLLMTGGQSSLLDEEESSHSGNQVVKTSEFLNNTRLATKVIYCNAEELNEHQQRLNDITKAGGICLWEQ